MFYTLSEDTLKIFLAVVAGALIGFEREYRSKAAGFRTMTLIAIGSTLFTIVSMKLGGAANGDRIAANIITGIGFLGAGVVFKDGFNVTGLTTATAIWVTAALGMTIGIGDYKMAAEGLVLVLLVLSAFELIQNFIDNLHQRRVYKITFNRDLLLPDEIEAELKKTKLKFLRVKEFRTENELVCVYEVSGSGDKFEVFNSYLLKLDRIRAFEC